MTEPITIYDHITANNRKTVMLVLLFPFSLILLVGLACELTVFIVRDQEFIMDGLLLFTNVFPSFSSLITPENRMFCAGFGYLIYAIAPIFALACLWMLIAYFKGDGIILRMVAAEPVTKRQEPKVYNMVENIAMTAGLPKPRLYIIEDNALNAFATGRNPENSSIVLTRGLINNLQPLELEGVVAHEMAHIGNRDIRLNLLIITGLGIFGLSADILRIFCQNSFSTSSKKTFYFQILLFLILLMLVVFNFAVAPLIRLAVSRSREYAADATGALITRNPDALASALLKISQKSGMAMADNIPLVSTACIASPMFGSDEADSLTNTHPSIKNRIKRLKAMSGLMI